MYLSDPRSTFSRIAVTTYPQMTCQGYVCQLSWLCAAKSLVFIIILLFYARLIFEETTVYESVMWLSHLCIPVFDHVLDTEAILFYFTWVLCDLSMQWSFYTLNTHEKNCLKVDWCMIQSMLFIVLGVVELGYIVNRAGWNASLFVPS